MTTAPAEFTSLETIDERARATLYRAVRVNDGLPVVLKVLTEVDPFAQDRLERECAMAQLVDSPVVLRCYGVTSFRGRPALILEDVGGHSLEHELDGRPISLDAFFALAIPLTASLADVHRRGVVHRDVKPSNVIVVRGTGVVKLADFGSATMVTGEGRASSLPRDDGTPAYMAPEQTGRMNRTVDSRADLYALGVTFFEMLGGALPFSASDALEWMHCHVAKAPPLLATVAPSVPEVVSAIVAKLLAKLPEDRYQTADGLLADLEQCAISRKAGRALAPFPLGTHDVSERFHIPQRLYGREQEARAAREAFKRVASTAVPALLLVSGYSGIGKTSLVRELYQPIARQRGLFASGKFDQTRRGVPYAAIAHAFGELVRSVLAADARTVERFADEARSALGGAARVITDVVPDVALLLGEQPPVPALGPSESQARFTSAFHALLRVFVKRDRPVALFLDDLQWADPASLALLRDLASSRDLGPLLLVLAYRDNEVDAAHPFSLALDEIRASGVIVDQLVLRPLNDESIEALVADSLHASPAEVAPLASLIARKTAGNPFFVSEFLKTLYLDGALRFDTSQRRWRWDDAELAGRAITDNVVHLMTDRLRRLPDAARNALRLASCIGSVFDLESLAAVDGRAVAAEGEALAEAIEGGLIAQVDSLHRGASVCYRFVHDRIQQAAYALVEAGDAAEVHLRIGRGLRERYGGTQLDARLFDIVGQLDAGVSLVVDPGERAALARLNIIAAAKAKSATAYSEAHRYLEMAVALLPSDAWQTNYTELFSVHCDLAECAYLSGALDEAGTRFEELARRAQSDIDAGAVYALQMSLLQVAGRYAEATDVALRAFALFKLDVPQTDADAGQAFVFENAVVEALLGDRPVASLIDAPPMTDARVRMIAKLLEAAGPPIYMQKPAYFGWLTVTLLRYSLEYGNAEPSCYAYGLYGITCAAVLGDVDRGYAFARLAIALNEKLGDIKLRCCVLHLLGDHVNFWKHHIANDLPILERGFVAGYEGGDLVYSNYIGFQSPWHLFESGARLDEVLTYTEKYAAFALRTKHTAVYETIRLEQRFVLALKGHTDAPSSFEGAGFSEEQALSVVVGAHFACGIVYYHVMKLIQRYTFGDFRGALAAADLAERDLAAAFSMPMQVSYYVFRALAQAALYANADDATRDAYLAEMVACHDKLRTWSKKCPENFADKFALIGAEIAQITGLHTEALRLYDEAISAAHRSGFTHYEALANERAAAAYTASGITSVAGFHVGRAKSLYARWGALAKVAQLEPLSSPTSRDTWAPSMPSESVTSKTSSTSQFDLLAVAKASQSLSSEIVLPRLLGALMHLVAEHAGAQRGLLLLVDGERMRVAAESDIDRAQAVVLEGDDQPADPTAMPLSIVNFVRRTRERVLLSDAAVRNAFSADPYVRTRAPRAVLCLPIERQRRLVGALYLENNRVPGAFSAERLAVLELLAAQAAISIENARLYKASQDAVATRDEFLRIASHELKTPLSSLQMRIHSLTRVLKVAPGVDLDRDRIAKIADVSDRQVSRLAKLIESMLDVSRIHAGELVLRRAPVDLAALVSSATASLAPELSAAGCEVEVDAPKPVVGEWDAARLEQVVTSLVANAIKFGAGRPISVAVSSDNDVARIAVQDRGIGIATEHHTTIFGRFERIASTLNVAGLGLGLFVGRAITAAHGGSISVASKPGEGATFVVELPVAAGRAVASTGAVTPSDTASNAPSTVS